MSKENKPVRKKSTPKKVNYNPGNKASRKNLILVGGLSAAVIVIAAIIFMTLTSLFSTESYYVLNTNVKSKQLITPEMVEARETAEGTAPVHSLSMEEIQRGGVYSKYPLFAGDVVARSNAGPLSGTPLGIPDDWLVTSFTINSTDAVGGILGKGDYADLLGIEGESGAAQYIFNNLLILEVKFLNDEFDGDLEGQTILGETMHYTIGLPAEHVAHLHSALNSGFYEDFKMIKSPTEVNYADRDVSKLDQAFTYGPEVGNIDMIEGSDPTFTEIQRDENGRPVNSASQSEDVEDDQEFIEDDQEFIEDDQEFIEDEDNEENDGEENDGEENDDQSVDNEEELNEEPENN